MTIALQMLIAWVIGFVCSLGIVFPFVSFRLARQFGTNAADFSC